MEGFFWLLLAAIVLSIALGLLYVLGVPIDRLFASTGQDPAAIVPNTKLPIGNQKIVASEWGQHPPFRDLVKFPSRPAPVTPFEDFNQTLFVLNEGAPHWPDEPSANDYPTIITGTLEFAEDQLKRKLRPGFPTIVDTCGWWDRASRQLELLPSYKDDVVKAYLALPVGQRPIVISRPFKDQYKGSERITFCRYGYEDFTLALKYLAGPTDRILLETMRAFMATDNAWLLFSPARVRKLVLEAASKERSATAFDEQLRQAAHANRFAALWDLPTEEVEEVPAEEEPAQ